jgi:hypothetical protein
LFWHKGDCICVKDNLFVALSIVFAAKTFVLRAGKASPIPKLVVFGSRSPLASEGVLRVLGSVAHFLKAYGGVNVIA